MEAQKRHAPPDEEGQASKKQHTGEEGAERGSDLHGERTLPLKEKRIRHDGLCRNNGRRRRRTATAMTQAAAMGRQARRRCSAIIARGSLGGCFDSDGRCFELVSPPASDSERAGVRLGEGPTWKLGGRIEELDYCSAGKRATERSDSTSGSIPICEPDQNPSGTVDQLVLLQGLCSMLLEQALNCSELADVKFVFDDGKSLLSGHRSVLCSVSETFSGMFRSGMRESRTGVVHVRGVSRSSFRGFLEWLYLGAAQNSPSPPSGGPRARRQVARRMPVYACLPARMPLHCS